MAAPVTRAHAFAKINWFLRVTDKRDDGFHNIESLFQRITISDTLSITPSDSLEVSTSADIPPEDNLVLRAARSLQQATSTDRGARMVLEKNIPIEAGLGGGSSDAALTIQSLNSLWELGLTPERLMEIGAGLGSDIPFFLSSPAALVTGRGEHVSPVHLERSCNLVIVSPPFGVSAAAAYAGLGALDQSAFDSDGFVAALSRGDMDKVAAMSVNDLERPVLRMHPEIGRIKAMLKKQGAVMSLMSGSGSAVFGVFRDQASAESAALRIREHDYWAEPATTIIH